MDEERIEVLFIEDTAADMILLREMLASSPDVVFATDESDRLSTAITRLAETHFDVIVLDLHLPDSRGLDTYTRLHAEAPDVPVVVLSASDDEDLAIEAVQRGAQDYLLKGQVDGDGLRRCLLYAIERTRIRRRLKDYLWRTSASEGRLRRVIEEGADGIVIADMDGQILYVNHTSESMLGKPSEDLLGEPFGFPLTSSAEVSVVQPSGEVVAIEVRTTETTWNGEPAHLASLRDITERRQAEELRHKLEVEGLRVRQLKELSHLKSLFVQAVSHELRTPMTPLKTAVTMLLDGSLGEVSGDQRRTLEMMDRNIQRLSRIATEVLDVSSEESGELRTHARIVDLESTLRPSVELMQPKAGVKEVQLTLELAEDARAYTDPDALSQVVASLLDNAINHCPDKTNIRISSAELEDGLVEIRIEDDGLGETAESMMREESSRDDEVVGFDTGMLFGLALCRSLVEQMGGALSFESRPGVGTTFRFSLPSA